MPDQALLLADAAILWAMDRAVPPIPSRYSGEWIHPWDMAADHVESFLTHLAVSRRVSASTQNQAYNALVFLFRDVVKKEIGEFNAVRAKRPIRLPAVLSQDEAKDY